MCPGILIQFLDRQGLETELGNPALGQGCFPPGAQTGEGCKGRGNGLGFAAENASGAEAGPFCASWGQAVGGARPGDVVASVFL